MRTRRAQTARRASHLRKAWFLRVGLREPGQEITEHARNIAKTQINSKRLCTRWRRGLAVIEAELPWRRASSTDLYLAFSDLPSASTPPTARPVADRRSSGQWFRGSNAEGIGFRRGWHAVYHTAHGHLRWPRSRCADRGEKKDTVD